MVLFINACVRKDSRTKRLADCLLETIRADFTELRLSDLTFPRVDERFLAERDRLIGAGDFGGPMFDLARQFARADEIVIAAPFWDLSFPSLLKQYFEQICVVGVTFRYSADGVPVGLCRAGRLVYVTTAGGNYIPESYGFGYVRALAQGFYGIPDVSLVSAGGLDVEGADVGRILDACEEDIRRRFGPSEKPEESL